MSNELKVGLAIVVSAVIFFIGVRYFQDIPLFSGSYELYTEFEEASGLAPGNAVSINGVRVGGIEAITLVPETKQVRVQLHINDGVTIPEGSYAVPTGISALGDVTLSIRLGDLENAPVAEGAFIPGRSSGGLSGLIEEAPQLVGRVDSMLSTAGATLGEARTLLDDPDSDLRQTLVAFRNTAASLNRLVASERARIGEVLDDVEDISGDLSAFTGESADTLSAAAANLNAALIRLDRNLVALEAVTAGLDAIVEKINRGEGTLGLMVNDASLYRRLDSAATNLNRLISDFEENPGRYLSEVQLVDIF